MKKRIIKSALALMLSLCITFGGMLPVFAEDNVFGTILGMLNGTTSGSSINVGEMLFDMITEESNKESAIDKMVNNLKDKFTGTGSTQEPDTDDDEEVPVEIDPGAAANVAELFNITVNEIKKGTPSFTKTTTATMDKEISQSLQGGLGVVTGLVESVIGTKDIFAGVLDGYSTETNTVIEHFESGNDIINNVSVAGQDYVACITADDIYDYTVSIYSTGRYKMHIDLKDVEGSAAQSGLSHVFDTTDKAFATIELGTTSININVKLKYTGCYVECAVDRRGNIQSFTTHMGITFLFQQEDGTYSTVMPYFDVDFEKEGIIYTVTTEYSDFEYDLRYVGDANGDGDVNSSDARLILRASSQLETLSEITEAYCDVDGNGIIAAADARVVLRASAMLDVLPTTEELLGITQYEKSESVQNHVDDLLILLLAYQTAADEETKKQLQDAYDDVYSEPTEDETTGTLNTTTEKVNDYVDLFGSILGGDFSSLGNLLG